MGRTRLLLVALLALPLALGAAMLARGMVAKPKAVTVIAAAPPKPVVQVLVAAKDLQPGDRIAKDSVNWKEWPVDGLSPTYISKGAGAPPPPVDPKAKAIADVKAKAGDMKTALLGDNAVEALTDSVVRVAMVAGEPIVAAKLVRPTDSGVMAVSLTEGMRAMSIPLSPETSAGGFIQPGDHVDVVQTRKVEVEGQSQWAASTVMKNVRVIAIDASTKPDAKSAATTGSTATLEVSPEQAENIVLAKAQGELTLVLRSYADASGPTTEGAVHRAAAEQVPVVRVFRPGGQIEQVKVAR